MVVVRHMSMSARVIVVAAKCRTNQLSQRVAGVLVHAEFRPQGMSVRLSVWGAQQVLFFTPKYLFLLLGTGFGVIMIMKP